MRFLGLTYTVAQASDDAPYESQDAHFWDWTAAILIVAVLVGLVVWGASAVV